MILMEFGWTNDAPFASPASPTAPIHTPNRGSYPHDRLPLLLSSPGLSPIVHGRCVDPLEPPLTASRAGGGLSPIPSEGTVNTTPRARANVAASSLGAAGETSHTPALLDATAAESPGLREISMLSSAQESVYASAMAETAPPHYRAAQSDGSTSSAHSISSKPYSSVAMRVKMSSVKRVG